MFTARMKIALAGIVASSYLVMIVGGFADVGCPSDTFSCDGRKTCLPERWLCDGEPDCKDATDENDENCDKKPVRNCTSMELTCENKKCLPKSWRCDGQDDCGDMSDERNCGTCADNEHRCGDEQCITGRWRCNGIPDCNDGSDERNCTTGTSARTFGIQSGSSNGSSDGNSNGTSSVNNNSTGIESNATSLYMFCQDGYRLPLSYACDGDKDCSDGSDEEDCDHPTVPEPFRCLDSEFQCSNSYCILQSWVCDGTADCQGAEDEHNCPNKTCSALHFTCSSGECIPRHEKCNGYTDCRDGSDEICDAIVTVVPTVVCNSTSHFQCNAGPCIPKKKLCNGRDECGDDQDESESLCGKNECERNNGGCEHTCVDTREGYNCACNKGYRLHGKYSCEDIDECDEVPGSCSQVCVNTRGSYHCSCQPGYLRDPGNYTRCKAAVGEAYLLFSHSYDIRRLRLRDRDMTSVVSDTHGATALDFHYDRNQILWSDRKEKKIFRADIANTRSREVVVAEEEVSADGLAVDWIHSLIYYTDTSQLAVKMVSWDHKWTKTLVTEEIGHPRAIVVSPMTGYVYWTDWGIEPKIERAGLDGSHREAIVKDPHVVWPNGITIDHSTNRLYWCDGRLNTISSSGLDGSHVEVILFSPSVLRLPYSISVFEDRLYWTDWSQLALYSANKFNGYDVQNVSAGHMLESPKVVHVFHKYRQPDGENICDGHRCSHICVRSIYGDMLCTCPDGHYLTGNNLTCAEGQAIPSEIQKPVITIDIHQEVNNIINVESSIRSTESSIYSNVRSPENRVQVESPMQEAIVQAKPEEQGTDTSPPVTPDHLGMILGVVLGSLAGLALGLVLFMTFSRFRRPITRFRFHNPVYRKTTDDESDGRGFTIAQEQLFYNPTREYGHPDSTLTMTEDDDAPLAPQDNSDV